MGSEQIFLLDDARIALGLPPQNDNVAVTHVAVDSRQCGPGALFVALPGEVTDGHRFVNDAFTRGAVGAIVAHDSAQYGEWQLPVLETVDPLQGLHTLATWYVDYALSSMVRIGVTGSNGKTTTKEMIRSVLQRAGYSVTASEGNLNSETGVPLSVFRADAHAAYGVFEMAMNHPGEMQPLAHILRPHYAIITTIGTAHIGYMGSRQAIAAEKKDITAHFNGSQTLIIPEADDFADFLSSDISGRVVYFGEHVQNAHLSGADPYTCIIDSVDVRLPVPGRHNGLNALAVWALAADLHLPIPAVRDGIAACSIPGGRNRVLQGSRERLILDDSYNASEESMLAAFDTVRALHDQRSVDSSLIVVLGAMKELGPFTRDTHRRTLVALAPLQPAYTVLVGKEEWLPAENDISAEDRKSLGVVTTHDNAGTAAAYLSTVLMEKETVLVKGSRSFHMEDVLEALCA